MWDSAIELLLVVLIAMTVVSTVAAAVMAALYLRCRRAPAGREPDAGSSETSIRLVYVQRRLQTVRDELYGLRRRR